MTNKRTLGFLPGILALALALLLVLTSVPAVFADSGAAAQTETQSESEAETEADAQAEAEAEEAEWIEEPTEELMFIDSLITDIGMPENALDAVNGLTNILLIGIDARPKEKTGRSDTMIILTLDAKHNSIKLTSFQRDLYVEIPGRSNNRMNAAYVFGGADLLKKTIKHNFGISVNYYVTVNFNTLADIIDQLGGLELTVEKKYVRRVNAIILNDNKVLGNKREKDFLKEGGTQLLNGRQAQAYARYRYGDPQGDAGRTRRQREVILKCMEKIKDMSLLSLGKMALDNFDKVETDMPITEMLKLAPAAFELLDGEIKELKIPVDGAYRSDTIHGMAVYVPNRTKNQKAVVDFILEEDD